MPPNQLGSPQSSSSSSNTTPTRSGNLSPWQDASEQNSAHSSSASFSHLSLRSSSPPMNSTPIQQQHKAVANVEHEDLHLKYKTLSIDLERLKPTAEDSYSPDTQETSGLPREEQKQSQIPETLEDKSALNSNTQEQQHSPTLNQLFKAPTWPDTVTSPKQANTEPNTQQIQQKQPNNEGTAMYSMVKLGNPARLLSSKRRTAALQKHKPQEVPGHEPTGKEAPTTVAPSVNADSDTSFPRTYEDQSGAPTQHTVPTLPANVPSPSPQGLATTLTVEHSQKAPSPTVHLPTEQDYKSYNKGLGNETHYKTLDEATIQSTIQSTLETSSGEEVAEITEEDLAEHTLSEVLEVVKLHLDMLSPESAKDNQILANIVEALNTVHTRYMEDRITIDRLEAKLEFATEFLARNLKHASTSDSSAIKNAHPQKEIPQQQKTPKRKQNPSSSVDNEQRKSQQASGGNPTDPARKTKKKQREKPNEHYKKNQSQAPQRREDHSIPPRLILLNAPPQLREEHIKNRITEEVAITDKRNILLNFKYATNKGRINWILQLDAQATKRLMQIGRLHFSNFSLKVDWYKPIRRCSRCQDPEHATRDCQSDKLYCANCSGDHHTNQCDSNEVHCVNCNTSNDTRGTRYDSRHKASSSICPAMQDYKHFTRQAK